MSDSDLPSSNGANASRTDAFQIEYPLFLIPHGGGYLSIVNPDDPTKQMLVVCSSRELALRLIYQFELMSACKELANDREFVWLLRSVKRPVNQVAFDPQPEAESVNAAEIVEIDELLSHRLKPDMSPWNYPVYAIANDAGFLSIESDDGGDEPLRLICIFTSKELAAKYMTSAEMSGEYCEIQDLGQAKTFFGSLDRSMAAAVALDPLIEEGKHSAKYCFSIEILLEKYLVGESPSA